MCAMCRVSAGVVQCLCNGDPHCRLFDGTWLHFQGGCEYILARDACKDGTITEFEPNVSVYTLKITQAYIYIWSQYVLKHIECFVVMC